MDAKAGADTHGRRGSLNQGLSGHGHRCGRRLRGRKGQAVLHLGRHRDSGGRGSTGRGGLNGARRAVEHDATRSQLSLIDAAGIVVARLLVNDHLLEGQTAVIEGRA